MQPVKRSVGRPPEPFNEPQYVVVARNCEMRPLYLSLKAEFHKVNSGANNIDFTKSNELAKRFVALESLWVEVSWLIREGYQVMCLKNYAKTPYDWHILRPDQIIDELWPVDANEAFDTEVIVE